MSKKSQKINFTKPPQWSPPEVGFTVTDELKKLLAQPGYLSDKNGGARASHLYSNRKRFAQSLGCQVVNGLTVVFEWFAESMNFRFDDFGLFGKACFSGNLSTVQWFLATGNAPPLSQKETAYEFGYASLVVTGAQRVAPMPGSNFKPDHYAVLELLISRGLPLSIPDIGGYTALHHSVLRTGERHNSFDNVTKEKVIRKLLTSGADINYRTRWGDTPLHYAIQLGDTLGIDLLMEHGADIDIPGGNGATVRDLYVRSGATVAAAIEKWVLKRSAHAVDLLPVMLKILALLSLSVAGLTVTVPFFRKAIFAILASLTVSLIFYQKYDGQPTDWFVGCFAMINLLRMSDFLLLTADVHKDLRRQGETLNISREAFGIRLKWALSLYASLRGVGWSHEPISHLPPAPKAVTKVGFITRQVLLLGQAYLYIASGVLLSLINASFYRDDSPFNSQPWWLRLTTFGSCLQFYGTLNALYALCGIIGVGLGLSAPKDWPPFFGPIVRAYTCSTAHAFPPARLLTILSFVCQQQPLESHGAAISNALRIPKGRFRTYFRLFVAFFISGILHQCGDYAVAGSWGGGSIALFLAHAGAITFEDAVQGLVKMLGIKVHPALAKVVGYIWVIGWFSYSFTIAVKVEPGVTAALTLDEPSLPGSDVVLRIARWVAP
ncbi:hypothetical protein NMY22_g12293 [Coprinellus aureogranulatus]|nr:hypothetical protein NMY22_g12293 [Coprinellus aureogranulatus]